MAELYLGLASARLGPAAALIDPQRGLVGACEENRLTRARQASTTGPPELATAELLEFFDRRPDDITAQAIVADEGDVDWWQETTAVAVGSGVAHAAYAHESSQRRAAVTLVCGAPTAQGCAAWRNGSTEPHGAAEQAAQFPLAQIYARLTAALGLQPNRDEHLVEALARAGRDSQPGIADLVMLTPEGVTLEPRFEAAVAEALQSGDRDSVRKDVAASVQRRLGDCLADLLHRLARHDAGETAVSVTGGLFFNTYFTTTAARCGAFHHVHVPAHPGRNGAAIGAALLAGAPGSSGGGGAASPRSSAAVTRAVASPYLGPSYSHGQIKEALDNCKLSYDLLREDRLFDDVLHAMSRGRLVGWFHGRLEWGPRALGHRSVLADPFGSHTLDNLNGFLKRRPSYRSYGVSVPLARVEEFFVGPQASPFMQFEYTPRDPEKFRTILPPGVETLRVHTVDEDEPRFLRLLELWGEKTGTPVLVNTSFNGFHEPLVCSPRDAIRVFYGTGLDVLALENFYLRK
jgi:carbamoyltransferase